ncbi:flagellar hook assembly protein FlgD [Roseobacter sp. N2S]|uniref:flagellar hook assembly protein FlgD n=1 Tax=Roseobacter sp. N2S TaxID=2663844 RepID=UPI0028617222|nr:flagellar hook assembly protein FlgD [Roseobacter sp. N2S]MDR6266722.1 flagellar basal-body rod modification protein FlgD [Roseobacter sp. N2S]
MSITSISSATVAGGADSSLSQLSQDYETFLQLMVAQIQNQDPLEPMDSTEFISQIATLTQVEQSVNTNSQLEQLRSTLALTASMSEATLIGRTVTVPSSTIKIDSVGTPVSFSYEIEGEASSATAIISDAEGNVLRTIEGLPGTAGTLNMVTWDGLDTNGAPMPVGTYQISLAAEDGTGGYNTYIRDTVESVSYVGGEQLLNLRNGVEANSGDIVMIE